MFCNKNQFQPFTFCGPHTKPHGVRGLITNYHMLFDINVQYSVYPFHVMNLHICLDVVSVKYVHGIPRSICNINQEK